MYRIIPLRTLRRTCGVKFDEIVPSDIPKIDGVDRVIHGPNAISPGPVGNVKKTMVYASKTRRQLDGITRYEVYRYL
jgi:hypothetical protein